MKRTNRIEEAKFDSAVADAFQDAPNCGAFGNFDDLSQRRRINEILIQAEEERFGEWKNTGSRRRAARILALSVAAALILCLTGALLFSTSISSSKIEVPSRPTYFGEVQALLGGTLLFGDTHAVVNAPIPVDESIRTEEGAAVLRLPTGITWQMGKHAHAEIKPLTSQRLQVDVLSGESWFRVNPKRKGPAFSVNTKMGRIDVTGTIFMVAADEQAVRITLLKGEVWVTHPSGRRELVAAGHTLRLPEDEQFALTPEDRHRMQNRLSALDWGTEKLPAATETALADDKPIIDATQPPPSRAARTKSTPTRQLLREIRTHRKHRNWGKVASLYRRLIQSAPGSEAAIVSRVSLGEIYLTKLQRYKEALRQFDNYLKSGHTALLPEASYGRCNALKAIGNRAKEIQCLDAFIKRFSGAFQTSKARARLEALRGRVQSGSTSSI